MRPTKLPCFVFLVSLVFLADGRIYQRSQRSELTEEDYGKDTKFEGVRDLEIHHRQKRGLAGLIVSGTMTAITVSSSVFQLWTAISGGCNIKPSICTDKDKIEEYEKELETLGETYDTLFYANQWKYLNLKLCMVNNQYILSYIDDEFRKIDDIGLQIEIITATLETDLKTMSKMFASNESAALENLAGPFDYQLQDIIKRIEGAKKSQLVGLIVQRSLEIFLSLTTNYVNKVIKNAIGVDNLDTEDSVINRLSSDNADLSSDKQTFWQKTKDYFKGKGKSLGSAFSAIGTDIKTKFTSTIPNNIKSWWQSAKKWSTFKQKVKASFLSPTSTITKIKNFFKSPVQSIKYAGKDYQFKPGQTFFQAVGLIVEGIQSYIAAEEWAAVAREISDSRKAYEKFIADIKVAIKELENETITLNGHWSDTITDFRSLVIDFNNVSTLARENKVFADIAGLTGLPVDTSHAFFTTDYNVVTEQDLKSKQEVVKDFFKTNGQSLSDILDKFKIQQILVSDTKELAKNNKSITFIYESLQRSFKNYDSGVMKNYSSEMVEKDVVCSASLVLPDRNEFDYYPTEEFREAKCDISEAKFSTMQLAAAEKRDRKILTDNVLSKVPEDKTPEEILDFVKGLYAASTDTRLKTFGTNLKEIDIVCEIATLFPTRNSYRLYDLTQFRPNCSNVTDAEYAKMKDDVTKMENAETIVKFSMDFCIRFHNCNCPSAMANDENIGLTESQIITLINEYKKENNLEETCRVVENNGQCSWQC